MIEVIRQQLTPQMPAEEKMNRTREFLQIICLKVLSDKGYFEQLAFTGGTALRLLFGVRRFSEDLDFSLIKKEGYAFEVLCERVLNELRLTGLMVEARSKDATNVHSLLVKFPGILKEVGLSALADQKLSVKLEIDSNPPAGGQMATMFVSRTYVFNVTHFDLPSMFATKLHACFYRKYTKGRDFYDLIWYMANKVRPNFRLLNNAISQTQGVSSSIGEKNFREFLLKGINKVDFVVARKDVERFLEDKSELRLFEKDLMPASIESYLAAIDLKAAGSG